MKSRLSGLALVAFLALGCGQGPLPMQAVTPVTMEVLVKGKPAINAQITLHPVAEPANGMPARPRGVVGPDGIAQFTSYFTNDGAPEGEYVVTVVWRPAPATASDDDKLGPDRFNGRYADAKTSSLRAVVRKDAKDVISLKLADN